MALTEIKAVTPVTDEELLQHIAQGDENALEVLYSQYYERLVRFLYRLSGDKSHIQEIVNDVFFIIWKTATNFRGDSTVSTWILGIAYKKGLQSTSRLKSLNQLDEKDSDYCGCEDTFIDERNIDQLLQGLSPQHRAVLELTYYFGYSYKEIGDIVDCPENTVKTRMFHARQRLRVLMEDDSYVKKTQR